MNRLVIVGILMISTAPLFAQGAQPDAAKLKADARNVVGIIGGDKAKTQAYCQIAIVGEQLEKSLGPEYLGLIESLGKANLPPKDGQEIVSTFDTLEASCPH